MKHHRIILIGILVLALIPRVWMLTQISPSDFYASPWYRGEGGDAAEYSAIAVNLAGGGGFSLEGRATNIRPPLYPFFLAGIYRVFGNENLTAVRIAQIVMALAMLALFWLLTHRLTASNAAAHLATLLLGLHPRFIIYNLVPLTETLFFSLMLVVCWYALRWHASGKTPHLTLAFCVLALAAFTRPTALYLAPVLALWAWYCNKKRGVPVFSLVLPGLLLFIALTGVWVARNYGQFHSFTFSNKSGGGLAEAWDRTILEPLGISNRDILAPYMHLSEEEFAKIGYKVFLTEIYDHPLLITKIILLKAVYWFNPFVKTSSGLFRMAHAALTSALFILGAYGLWHFWKMHGKEIPLLFLLLMGIFSAMHILTVPYHRYRFPVIEPYLMLFASYAVVEMLNKLKNQKQK